MINEIISSNESLEEKIKLLHSYATDPSHLVDLVHPERFIAQLLPFIRRIFAEYPPDRNFGPTNDIRVFFIRMLTKFKYDTGTFSCPLGFTMLKHVLQLVYDLLPVENLFNRYLALRVLYPLLHTNLRVDYLTHMERLTTFFSIELRSGNSKDISILELGFFAVAEVLQYLKEFQLKFNINSVFFEEIFNNVRRALDAYLASDGVLECNQQNKKLICEYNSFAIRLLEFVSMLKLREFHFVLDYIPKLWSSLMVLFPPDCYALRRDTFDTLFETVRSRPEALGSLEKFFARCPFNKTDYDPLKIHILDTLRNILFLFNEEFNLTIERHPEGGIPYVVDNPTRAPIKFCRQLNAVLFREFDLRISEYLPRKKNVSLITACLSAWMTNFQYMKWLIPDPVEMRRLIAKNLVYIHRVYLLLNMEEECRDAELAEFPSPSTAAHVPLLLLMEYFKCVVQSMDILVLPNSPLDPEYVMIISKMVLFSLNDFSSQFGLLHPSADETNSQAGRGRCDPDEAALKSLLGRANKDVLKPGVTIEMVEKTIRDGLDRMQAVPSSPRYIIDGEYLKCLYNIPPGDYNFVIRSISTDLFVRHYRVVFLWQPLLDNCNSNTVLIRMANRLLHRDFVHCNYKQTAFYRRIFPVAYSFFKLDKQFFRNDFVDQFSVIYHCLLEMRGDASHPYSGALDRRRRIPEGSRADINGLSRVLNKMFLDLKSCETAYTGLYFIYNSFEKAINELFTLYCLSHRPFFLETLFNIPVSLNLLVSRYSVLVKPMQLALRSRGRLRKTVLRFIDYITEFDNKEGLMDGILHEIAGWMEEEGLSAQKILGRISNVQKSRMVAYPLQAVDQHGRKALTVRCALRVEQQAQNGPGLAGAEQFKAVRLDVRGVFGPLIANLIGGWIEHEAVGSARNPLAEQVARRLVAAKKPKGRIRRTARELLLRQLLAMSGFEDWDSSAAAPNSGSETTAATTGDVIELAPEHVAESGSATSYAQSNVLLFAEQNRMHGTAGADYYAARVRCAADVILALFIDDGNVRTHQFLGAMMRLYAEHLARPAAKSSPVFDAISTVLSDAMIYAYSATRRLVRAVLRTLDGLCTGHMHRQQTKAAFLIRRIGELLNLAYVPEESKAVAALHGVSFYLRRFRSVSGCPLKEGSVLSILHAVKYVLGRASSFRVYERCLRLLISLFSLRGADDGRILLLFENVFDAEGGSSRLSLAIRAELQLLYPLNPMRNMPTEMDRSVMLRLLDFSPGAAANWKAIAAMIAPMLKSMERADTRIVVAYARFLTRMSYDRQRFNELLLPAKKFLPSVAILEGFSSFSERRRFVETISNTNQQPSARQNSYRVFRNLLYGCAIPEGIKSNLFEAYNSQAADAVPIKHIIYDIILNSSEYDLNILDFLFSQIPELFEQSVFCETEKSLSAVYDLIASKVLVEDPERHVRFFEEEHNRKLRKKKGEQPHAEQGGRTSPQGHSALFERQIDFIRYLVQNMHRFFVFRFVEYAATGFEFYFTAWLEGFYLDMSFYSKGGDSHAQHTADGKSFQSDAAALMYTLKYTVANSFVLFKNACNILLYLKARGMHFPYNRLVLLVYKELVQTSYSFVLQPLIGWYFPRLSADEIELLYKINPAYSCTSSSLIGQLRGIENKFLRVWLLENLEGSIESYLSEEYGDGANGHEREAAGSGDRIVRHLSGNIRRGDSNEESSSQAPGEMAGEAMEVDNTDDRSGVYSLLNYNSEEDGGGQTGRTAAESTDELSYSEMTLLSDTLSAVEDAAAGEWAGSLSLHDHQAEALASEQASEEENAVVELDRIKAIWPGRAARRHGRGRPGDTGTDNSHGRHTQNEGTGKSENASRALPESLLMELDRLVGLFKDNPLPLIEFFAKRQIESETVKNICGIMINDVSVRHVAIYYLCLFDPREEYFSLVVKLSSQERAYAVRCLMLLVDRFGADPFLERIVIVIRSEMRFTTSRYVMVPLIIARPKLAQVPTLFAELCVMAFRMFSRGDVDYQLLRLIHRTFDYLKKPSLADSNQSSRSQAQGFHTMIEELNALLALYELDLNKPNLLLRCAELDFGRIAGHFNKKAVLLYANAHFTSNPTIEAHVDKLLEIAVAFPGVMLGKELLSRMCSDHDGNLVVENLHKIRNISSDSQILVLELILEKHLELEGRSSIHQKEASQNPYDCPKYMERIASAKQESLSSRLSEIVQLAFELMKQLVTGQYPNAPRLGVALESLLRICPAAVAQWALRDPAAWRSEVVMEYFPEMMKRVDPVLVAEFFLEKPEQTSRRLFLRNLLLFYCRHPKTFPFRTEFYSGCACSDPIVRESFVGVFLSQFRPDAVATLEFLLRNNWRSVDQEAVLYLCARSFSRCIRHIHVPTFDSIFRKALDMVAAASRSKSARRLLARLSEPADVDSVLFDHIDHHAFVGSALSCVFRVFSRPLLQRLYELFLSTNLPGTSALVFGEAFASHGFAVTDMCFHPLAPTARYYAAVGDRALYYGMMKVTGGIREMKTIARLCMFEKYEEAQKCIFEVFRDVSAHRISFKKEDLRMLENELWWIYRECIGKFPEQPAPVDQVVENCEKREAWEPSASLYSSYTNSLPAEQIDSQMDLIVTLVTESRLSGSGDSSPLVQALADLRTRLSILPRVPRSTPLYRKLLLYLAVASEIDEALLILRHSRSDTFYGRFRMWVVHNPGMLSDMIDWSLFMRWRKFIFSLAISLISDCDKKKVSSEVCRLICLHASKAFKERLYALSSSILSGVNSAPTIEVQQNLQKHLLDIESLYKNGEYSTMISLINSINMTRVPNEDKSKIYHWASKAFYKLARRPEAEKFSQLSRKMAAIIECKIEDAEQLRRRLAKPAVLETSADGSHLKSLYASKLIELINELPLPDCHTHTMDYLRNGDFSNIDQISPDRLYFFIPQLESVEGVDRLASKNALVQAAIRMGRFLDSLMLAEASSGKRAAYQQHREDYLAAMNACEKSMSRPDSMAALAQAAETLFSFEMRGFFNMNVAPATLHSFDEDAPLPGELSRIRPSYSEIRLMCYVEEFHNELDECSGTVHVRTTDGALVRVSVKREQSHSGHRPLWPSDERGDLLITQCVALLGAVTSGSHKLAKLGYGIHTVPTLCGLVVESRSLFSLDSAIKMQAQRHRIGFSRLVTAFFRWKLEGRRGFYKKSSVACLAATATQYQSLLRRELLTRIGSATDYYTFRYNLITSYSSAVSVQYLLGLNEAALDGLLIDRLTGHVSVIYSGRRGGPVRSTGSSMEGAPPHNSPGLHNPPDDPSHSERACSTAGGAEKCSYWQMPGVMLSTAEMNRRVYIRPNIGFVFGEEGKNGPLAGILGRFAEEFSAEESLAARVVGFFLGHEKEQECRAKMAGVVFNKIEEGGNSIDLVIGEMVSPKTGLSLRKNVLPWL